MALNNISVVSRLIAGVQRNIDLSASNNCLVVDYLKAQTQIAIDTITLNATELATLKSQTHASGSDNQNVTAGDGLTGGGSGATPTLAVGQGDGISVSADAVAVDSTVIRAGGSVAFTADQPMGADSSHTHKITLMTDGSADTDAATYGQVKVKANDSAVIKKDGSVAFTGAQSMGGFRLMNLASPSGSSDAVTKAYADALVSGLHLNDPVAVATTASINAFATFSHVGAHAVGASYTSTGPGPWIVTVTSALHELVGTEAITTSNATGPSAEGVQSITVIDDNHFSFSVSTTDPGAGTLDWVDNDNGKGSTFTYTATGAKAFDSVTLTLGMRVLVKNEVLTNAFKNGIFVVTSDGIGGGDDATHVVLTRALDFDGSPDNEVVPSDYVFVQKGTTLASTGWAIKNDGQSPIKVDTDAIDFVQFSGAGTYLAAQGIFLDGSTFKLAVGTTGQVYVCDADGIPTLVSASGDVTVAAGGAFTIGSGRVTNGMLAGSIADTNLSTISTSGKVAGTAVQLSSGEGLENSAVAGHLGLKVHAADLAGNGLEANGTNDWVLQVKLATNSGLAVDGNGLKVSGGSTPSLVAGETLAANTIVLVRMAVSGETAGRVYKADNAAAVGDPEHFYVVGIAYPASEASVGDSLPVTISGALAVGTNTFFAADVGKPVFLDASGAATVTPPPSSIPDVAVVCVGVVQDRSTIWVMPMQLRGIT